MLSTTKKIRNAALVMLFSLWMVSVFSLGMNSINGKECDPYCPMDTAQKEINYKSLNKKVMMLSGVVGWFSQYYGK